MILFYSCKFLTRTVVHFDLRNSLHAKCVWKSVAYRMFFTEKKVVCIVIAAQQSEFLSHHIFPDLCNDFELNRYWLQFSQRKLWSRYSVGCRGLKKEDSHNCSERGDINCHRVSGGFVGIVNQNATKRRHYSGWKKDSFRTTQKEKI